MREKSLDFLGYPNYSVTDDGRVFSLDYHREGYKKELKPRLYCGYNRITLCKDGKVKYILIHRLVALAFIPNPDNLPIINHKDENPSNNNVENLEWCSIKYNNTYGTRLERSAIANWKPIRQFTKDGLFIKEYTSLKEAARQTGFYKSAISQCCNGKLKSSHGYIWRYA